MRHTAGRDDLGAGPADLLLHPADDLLHGADVAVEDAGLDIGDGRAPDGLRRDLPLGSELEITVSAKEPGALKVEAYVPLLDESFSVKLEYDRKAASNEDVLRKEFKAENDRVADVLKRANAQNSDEASKLDGIVDDINSKWDAAGAVEGAAQIQRRIIEMRVILDDLEERSKFPEKVEDVKARIEEIEEYSAEMNSAQRSELKDIKERLVEVEARKSVAEVERFKQDVLNLWREVYVDRFDFWAGNLAYLYKTRDRLPNTAEVNRLFEQGARAMDLKDKESVRRCVIRLWDLSPQDVVEEAKRGHGSDVTI